MLYLRERGSAQGAVDVPKSAPLVPCTELNGFFGGRLAPSPGVGDLAWAYGQVDPVVHWLKTTDTELTIGAVVVPRSTNRKTVMVSVTPLVGIWR